MTTGAPDLSKHGRESSRQEILVPNFSAESKHGPCLFEGSERQAKRMISYRLCNSIKLLQTHSKKNMLSCCLQQKQIKQTPNTKDYFCHWYPPYKNTSQRIPAPKNQLPNSTKTTAANFFGAFFDNARCGVAGFSFRLAEDQKLQTTQRSWEKKMINSGYWRCVAWCSFKKSDWLACLAATCVMHLCVRLWFGDSYWSNLSCETGESWLASWCLVGKRLTIAREAIVRSCNWCKDVSEIICWIV